MTAPGWKDALGSYRPRAAGPCPDGGAFVAFYRGELAAVRAGVLRDHVVDCERCRETARDARLFLEAMAADGPEAEAAAVRPPVVEPPRPPVPAAPTGLRGWPLAAALLAAVAGGAAWWGLAGTSPASREAGPAALEPPRSGVSSPPRRVEAPRLRKAPYSPGVASFDELLWRGTRRDARRPPPSAGEAFARAMVPYEAGDLAEAERRLAAVAASHPGHHDALFYRGVCLLLLGRAREGIAVLEPVARDAPGRRRQEALWYLALGHLHGGAPRDALPALQALSGLDGPRRAEAARLQEEILAAGAP
jgi:hypothetical protein